MRHQRLDGSLCRLLHLLHLLHLLLRLLLRLLLLLLLLRLLLLLLLLLLAVRHRARPRAPLRRVHGAARAGGRRRPRRAPFAALRPPITSSWSMVCCGLQNLL